MRIAALVLAAGQGERAGGKIPKQYASLPGGAPIARVVGTFLRHERIHVVCVTIAPEHHALAEDALAGLAGPRLLPFAEGRNSRQESALAGLRMLHHHAPSHVLIHDAARPHLRDHTITSVIEMLQETDGGVVPVLPITDCVWETGPEETCTRPLPRESLRAAQTPQGFPYLAIREAHETHSGACLADDASVACLAGLPIRSIPGDPQNSKLTTPEDIIRSRTPVRTGQGIDVHAFGPGNGLRLCGVHIPFEYGLVGHSDADVGLHALTDAIYGALGEADIGTHFPPDDKRWKGCDSCVFVKDAVQRATRAGYIVSHVDLTLICERPAIAPHREEMRISVARMLGASPAQISIKATTTEHLGFIGRGEGIAAFALATLADSQ